MSGRLAGKVALVTGAARGIGETCSRRFAREGATVVLTDIRHDEGEATARDIGAPAIFLPLDVRHVEAWERVVAMAVDRCGGIDILVNNAGGGGGGGAIERDTPDDHRNVVALNLTGVWAGMRAVVGPMTARGGGSIVNISSIDGLVGVAGLTTYVGTKFAVTGMTKALALELGDRGIRVNSVHPGIIATPMVRNTHPASMARLEKAIARQPLRRMGTPDDIAHAVLFFASDESAYCTGSMLAVDGGHTAGPYRDPF